MSLIFPQAEKSGRLVGGQIVGREGSATALHAGFIADQMINLDLSTLLL